MLPSAMVFSSGTRPNGPGDDRTVLRVDWALADLITGYLWNASRAFLPPPDRGLP